MYNQNKTHKKLKLFLQTLLYTWYALLIVVCIYTAINLAIKLNVRKILIEEVVDKLHYSKVEVLSKYEEM